MTSRMFYSDLVRTIEEKFPGRATINQASQMIDAWARKGEFRREELEWSGVLEWIATISEREVSKTALLHFARSNQIRLEEVIRGDDQSDAVRTAMLQEIEQIKTDLLPHGEFDCGIETTIEYGPGVYDWFRFRQPLLGDDSIIAFGESDAGDYPLLKNHRDAVVTTFGARVYERLTRAQEVMAHLAGGFEQAPLGSSARYANYTLPGGTNYRELLITLPAMSGWEDDLIQEFAEELAAIHNVTLETALEDVQIALDTDDYHGGFPASLRQVMRSAREQGVRANTFRTPHFDVPNILAHVRFKERVDIDGKRVLFIEELQSDWAQKGRKEGFRPSVMSFDEWRKENVVGTPTPAARDRYETYRRLGDPVSGAIVKGVPRAPFVTQTDSWSMLAMRRMMRWAVENDFDRIGWTTGEQQADRYDLSKHIDAITYVHHIHDDSYSLKAWKNGSSIRWFSNGKRRVSSALLDDLVGKDVADHIRKGRGQAMETLGYRDLSDPEKVTPSEGKMLAGLDLRVGGEGMKGFYDQILPAAVNKYVKKWGGKVGTTDVFTDSEFVAVADSGQRVVFQEYSDAENWLVEHGEDSSAIEQIPGGRRSVHVVEVTDAMRMAVLDGQPMFLRHRSAGQVTDTSQAQIKPDTLLQRVPRTSDGMSTSEVSALVSEICSSWRNRPDFVVVQSIADLPPHIEEPIRSIGAERETRGVFDNRGDRVYLVAGNLTDRLQVEEAIFHETLGHYGLRRTLGKAIVPLLREVYELYVDESRRIADLYGLDLTRPIDRLKAAEEVLANMAAARAKTADEQKMLDKLFMILREWLRNLGMKMKLNDDDVCWTLSKARRYVTGARREMPNDADGLSREQISNIVKGRYEHVDRSALLVTARLYKLIESGAELERLKWYLGSSGFSRADIDGKIGALDAMATAEPRTLVHALSACMDYFDSVGINIVPASNLGRNGEVLIRRNGYEFNFPFDEDGQITSGATVLSRTARACLSSERQSSYQHRDKGQDELSL